MKKHLYNKSHQAHRREQEAKGKKGENHRRVYEEEKKETEIFSRPENPKQTQLSQVDERFWDQKTQVIEKGCT